MSVCYSRFLDNSIPPVHKKETKCWCYTTCVGPQLLSSLLVRLEMPLRVAMLKAGAIDRASSTRRLLAAQACSWKSQAMCSRTDHQWSQALPPLSPVPLVFLSFACHNVRLLCHVYLIDRERRQFDLHPAARVLYLLNPNNSESKQKLAKCFLGSSTTLMRLLPSPQCWGPSDICMCFCYSTQHRSILNFSVPKKQRL